MTLWKRLWRSKFANMSLRNKLLCFFAVLFAVSTILSFIVVFQIIASDYRAQTEKRSDASLREINMQLQRITDALMGAVHVVSYNEDVRAILTDIAVSPKNCDLAQAYRQYQQLQNILLSAQRNINPIANPDGSASMLRLYLYPNDFYSENNDTFRNIINYPELLRALQTSTGGFWAFPAVQTESDNRISYFDTISSSVDFHTNAGAVSASIPRQDILQILNGSDLTENGITFLLDSQTGFIGCSGAESENRILLCSQATQAAASDQWITVQTDEGAYLTKSYIVGNTGWVLGSLIPMYEITAPAQHAGTAMGMVMAVIFVAAMFVAVAFSQWFTKRLRLLAKSMIRVQQGDWNVTMRLAEKDEVGLLFESFNYMLAELKRFSKKQYEDIMRIKSAELRALQAQINPHFLYNTLDLIVWEARKNNDPDAAEIAHKLAHFYRLGLKNGHDIVTLQDEIMHIRAYINIQDRRFPGIQLTVKIPQELYHCAIPRLTLQPIVENAILHGLQGLADNTKKHLLITASQTGDLWNVTISDNGHGISEDKMHHLLDEPSSDNDHGFGLGNIEARLKLFFGEQACLIFDSMLHIGTTVIIMLPFAPSAQLPPDSSQ